MTEPGMLEPARVPSHVAHAVKHYIEPSEYHEIYRAEDNTAEFGIYDWELQLSVAGETLILDAIPQSRDASGAPSQCRWRSEMGWTWTPMAELIAEFIANTYNE